MAKPKKWTEVYPQGSVEGDEEISFFRALARDKKNSYRSVAQLVSSTGLSRQRIEEIIDKYANMKPPLIVPHISNEEHWGYWERCMEDEEDTRSLSQKDQDNRIDRQMQNTCPNMEVTPIEPEKNNVKEIWIDIPEHLCATTTTIPEPTQPTFTLDWSGRPQSVTWTNPPPLDINITWDGPQTIRCTPNQTPYVTKIGEWTWTVQPFKFDPEDLDGKIPMSDFGL